jgi:hypothetical protein
MKYLPAIGLLLALAVAPASQAEQRLFLSGGEYSDAVYYAYAGLIVPGPARENGRGFFQRYWVDGLGYEYNGAPGRVKADAWGGEASLGYGSSNATGWGSVSLGLRYTDTSLSPDDPSATARGSQTGVKVQLEGETEIAPSWRLGGIASYTSAQNGYWGRMRLVRRSTAASSVGAEFVLNGNDEAQSSAAGLLFSMQPSGGAWNVLIKAGYRFASDADGIYGGLEFGYGF